MDIPRQERVDHALVENFEENVRRLLSAPKKAIDEIITEEREKRSAANADKQK